MADLIPDHYKAILEGDTIAADALRKELDRSDEVRESIKAIGQKVARQFDRLEHQMAKVSGDDRVPHVGASYQEVWRCEICQSTLLAEAMHGTGEAVVRGPITHPGQNPCRRSQWSIFDSGPINVERIAELLK